MDAVDYDLQDKEGGRRIWLGLTWLGGLRGGVFIGTGRGRRQRIAGGDGGLTSVVSVATAHYSTNTDCAVPASAVSTEIWAVSQASQSKISPDHLIESIPESLTHLSQKISPESPYHLIESLP